MDEIVDHLQTKLDEFSLAELPYWGAQFKNEDSLERFGKGDFSKVVEDQSEAYKRLHFALVSTRSACVRIETAGILDLDLDNSSHGLTAYLTILDASMWASYYCSLAHSENEINNWLKLKDDNPEATYEQKWEQAWSEIVKMLKSSGLEKPELLTEAKALVTSMYPQKDYPEVQRLQFAEGLRRMATEKALDRYKAIAEKVAPLS